MILKIRVRKYILLCCACIFCCACSVTLHLMTLMAQIINVSIKLYINKKTPSCKHEVAALSKYPARQIGFSKFCRLCPKWCVFPGSSGTHSVCVCTHHQNMELILVLGVSHTELYDLVCDINSKDCMIHRCPNCPENTEMLESKLYELTGDYDDKTVIEFNQWTSTD